MSTEPSPQEAQDIARRAFIYGFPMVEHYQLMYVKAVTSPAGFNEMVSEAKLYGPEDTDVITPNNDTPYSMAWLDLRTQPVVVQVPAISPERYWSFQIIDYFTNNFSYIGTRATPPAETAQQFLFVGPDWVGSAAEVPGIAEVIHCPGQIMFLIGRTQLFGELDLPQVEEIQAGYTVTLLNDYLGTPPPVPAPPYDFVPFDPSLKATLTFFTYMNQGFVFQLPPAPDGDLMAEFARIGVGPGLTFDRNDFSEPVQQAMLAGMQQAMADIVEETQRIGLIVGGWNMPKVDQPYFGTTPDDYFFRAAIGYKGIYANSPIEALYPMANRDGGDQELTGEKAYTLLFEGNNLPPAQFFWSLTMYDAVSRLLVANEIDRYSISNRTDGILFGPGGSLQFYLQSDSPQGDAVRNWLPAPDGPFYVVLRVYGPEGSMLEGEYGTYRVPPIELQSPAAQARSVEADRSSASSMPMEAGG